MHREPGMGTEGDLWTSEKQHFPNSSSPSLLFSHLSAPGRAGLPPMALPLDCWSHPFRAFPCREQGAAFCVRTNALNSSFPQRASAGEARPRRFPPFYQNAPEVASKMSPVEPPLEGTNRAGLKSQVWKWERNMSLLIELSNKHEPPFPPLNKNRDNPVLAKATPHWWLCRSGKLMTCQAWGKWLCTH